MLGCADNLPWHQQGGDVVIGPAAREAALRLCLDVQESGKADVLNGVCDALQVECSAAEIPQSFGEGEISKAVVDEWDKPARAKTSEKVKPKKKSKK